jgi:hypothetical protein
MSAIKLSTPSSGSISLSPADTASNLTITVPAVSATMATLTTPSFATTIGVGGATPAVSGAGITFPATQSASSNANTLDDYEEGTWTPTLTAGSPVYTEQAGWYTKIGDTVHVWGSLTITSKSASVAEAGIGNLPFSNSGAGSNRFMSLSCIGRAYSPGGIAPSTMRGSFLSVESTSAYVRLPDGVNNNFTTDSFGSSGSLWFAAVYKVY